MKRYREENRLIVYLDESHNLPNMFIRKNMFYRNDSIEGSRNLSLRDILDEKWDSFQMIP